MSHMCRDFVLAMPASMAAPLASVMPGDMFLFSSSFCLYTPESVKGYVNLKYVAVRFAV